jgi:DNA (cytosine-5)-methyltransferase 1
VNGIRRLTGKEMMRLQGFPDNFKMDIPYTQIRKIAGNSVSVPVIKEIADQIIYSLDNKPLSNEYSQLEMEIS